jgi:hypothetical protein
VLVSAAACSVYDESLLTVSGTVEHGGSGGVSGGGSGGASGSAGSAGTGSAGAGTGGGGTGGTAGSSSTPAGNAGAAEGGQGGDVAVPTYELIDDMEDGNTIVLPNGGRTGRWVTDNDGTGTTTPPKTNFPGLVSELATEDARDGSTHSVHLRAEGFTMAADSWGAFVGVHFKSPDSTPYDASAYCGIHFWAKRGADVNALYDQIEIRIPDMNTVPAGGNCVDPAAASGAGGGPGFCYDHHAKILYPTDEWEEYTVLFSEMHQGNWPGYEQSPDGELDLAAVTSVEFYLNRPMVYDLWVDDLSFINKPEGGDCP